MYFTVSVFLFSIGTDYISVPEQQGTIYCITHGYFGLRTVYYKAVLLQLCNLHVSMATPTLLPRAEMATVAVQPKVEHPTKDPGRAVSSRSGIQTVYVAVGQEYCFKNKYSTFLFETNRTLRQWTKCDDLNTGGLVLICIV